MPPKAKKTPPKVPPKPAALKAPKKQKSKNAPVVMQKAAVSPGFSQEVGNYVGTGIGLLGRFLGFGAYTVKKNSIVGAGGSIPSMHSTRDSIIVRHREYVGDILSSTSFTSNAISLNPGLTSSYPWLSKIASAFQQYKLLGLVVEYIPEVSEIAANEISLGFVCLAADYRADLPSYPSLNQALESEFAVSGKPNVPLVLAVECDPRQSAYNSWFVRTGPVPTGEDVKIFDFANVNVLVGNNQTGSIVLGQLWYSYEIELLRPTSFLDPPAIEFFLHLTSNVPVSANPVGPSPNLVSYSNPVGTNSIGGTSYLNMIGVNYANDGGTVSSGGGFIHVTLPRGITGAFQMTYACTGASTASVVLIQPSFAISNASFINTMIDVSGPYGYAPVVAETTTQVLATAFFNISDLQASTGNCVIIFGSASMVIPGAPAFADFIVVQTSSAIF